MGPLFSVIIPTYGRPDFLASAINSLLRQTVTEFEALIIDDASPTRVEIAQDPRLRLIRLEENSGPAAARNTGLNEAQGRFITFLDDDDLYTEHRLELALRGLEHADVTVCWTRFIDEHDSPGRILDGDVADTILDATTPHLGATAVVREQAIPFDSSFNSAEDLDWWLRLARNNSVSTVRQTGYLMRRHDGPRIRTSLRERIKGSQRLLDRHSDYFATHPAALSFRLKRIGLMALTAGDRALARSALFKSLRIRPDLVILKQLTTAIGPSTSQLEALENWSLSGYD